MACKHLYIDELVPKDQPHALFFGSLIHECLAHWYTSNSKEETLSIIDKACINRAGNEKEKATWHLAKAMMQHYFAKYEQEDFKIMAVEKEFSSVIVNPETGASSRTFSISGVLDAIVQKDDKYYLMEHKTTAMIDSGYLERLWTDFQIILYSHYAEKAFNIKISGTIYNILTKVKLRQGRGETEAEYEERKKELIAKSKTGKTSAKQKIAESDEDFQARLAVKYQAPDMFVREMIYLSRDRFTELLSELWELSQSMLDARRRGTFYRNTSYCFNYNRPCAYYPICSSGGNPVLIENLYEKREAHEELKQEKEKEPVF